MPMLTSERPLALPGTESISLRFDIWTEDLDTSILSNQEKKKENESLLIIV